MKKLYVLTEVDNNLIDSSRILCTSMNGSTIKSELKQRLLTYQGFGYQLMSSKSDEPSLTLMIHVEQADGMSHTIDAIHLYK
jgi:hypothetical protein